MPAPPPSLRIEDFYKLSFFFLHIKIFRMSLPPSPLSKTILRTWMCAFHSNIKQRNVQAKMLTFFSLRVMRTVDDKWFKYVVWFTLKYFHVKYVAYYFFSTRGKKKKKIRIFSRTCFSSSCSKVTWHKHPHMIKQSGERKHDRMISLTVITTSRKKPCFS